MVTFEVDEVKPVVDRLPARPLRQTCEDALLFGRDPELPVIDHGPTHALLGAVHVAFAQHRPLLLSPDAIWLTIAAGIAQHVRINAERLRPRLVRHAGTKILKVTVGDVPTDVAGWAAVIPQFRAELAKEIGDGRARLLECAFSTTGDVELLASQIVLMDVYSPYFDLWMMCVCGIPSVTLTGTADDWRAIRARVDVLAELDLEFWAGSLRPILDQFVRAAERTPDRAFWKRIYKPAEAYGGDVITGWIARLYPYLVSGGKAEYRNPLLDLPIDEPKDLSNWPTGIKSDQVLAGASSVRINIAGATATRAVQLEAGVTIVVQDASGCIAPCASWQLRPGRAQIEDVVDKIRASCTYRDATDQQYGEGPAEVIALFNLISSATIRGWELGGTPRSRSIQDNRRYLEVTHLLAGPGRRTISFTAWRDQIFYVMGNDKAGLRELQVVGTRLGDVLDALLATGEPPASIGMLGDLVT